ncbi:MAG: DUF4279 domain-containing protein [Leptolyngbyaceae cyanobacterium bins.349]|nr:DUF4279 domain-containing protein [Leptolyngbyaceae cyanobacterium bins.349]
MASECYASFVLTGLDLNPDEITAKTGVIPTKTWRVGDLISPQATIRYQHNGWRLSSQRKFVDFEDADDLADHVRAVLEQLHVSWQTFVEVGAQFDSEVCCIIYTGGERPAIHFDRAILNQLSELNAELDVDLYVLPEDSSERTSAS